MFNAALRLLIFIGVILTCLLIAVPDFRDFAHRIVQEASHGE